MLKLVTICAHLAGDKVFQGIKKKILVSVLFCVGSEISS